MKILSLAILSLISVNAIAQWQGTNPVYFNTGNVGIGTSTPSVWFGSKTFEFSDTRPVLKLSSTSPTGLSTVVFTNTSVNTSSHYGEFHLNYAFNQSANDKSTLNFSPYPGSNALVLQADGNIGIGTTSPTSLLHLNSAIERNTFRIYKNTTTANYLSIWQGDAGAAIDPIGTGVLRLGYDQSTNVLMGITGAGVNSGNVGIGTSTPGVKLVVNGTGGINTDMVVNGRIQTGDGSNAGGVWVSGGTGTMFMGQATTTSMGWYNNGSWRMIADNSGNVGIGTLSPDQKLTVNGIIHAKEVRVDLSVPGPDYVFANNYQLPTLNEVETYIDQNKHLPEVPSAKEMEKNGIQVGEMNMLLLKKIEELTLYIIEQNKKLTTQNELLLQQNERILKLENSKQN